MLDHPALPHRPANQPGRPLLTGSVLLFKFGQRRHLEEFRDDGVLFMQSQRHFAELETDPARSDRFETTDRIVQPALLKHLAIDKSDGQRIIIPPKNFVGPLRINLGSPPCNIYCMFGVTERPSGPFVDKRNFDFGDSFIAILHTQEFVDRICAAAEAAGLEREFGFVEYFDEATHTGETGPFRKPLRFAHQQEFRIVVRPGVRGPIRLKLSSLADITTDIFPLAQINELVDFGPKIPKPGVDDE